MAFRGRRASVLGALIAFFPLTAAADPAASADSTQLARIEELVDAGQWDRARELGRALVESEAAEHGRRSVAVAEAMHALHRTFSGADLASDDALAVAEEALAIREELFEEGAPELATALHDLGLTLTERGEYDRAIELLERRLEIQEGHLPPNHPDLARANQDVGYALYRASRYHEVVPYSEDAVAIMRRADPVDRAVLGRSLFNLSALYMALGDYERAEPLLEEATGILREEWGPGDVQFASVQINLALLKARLGQQSEALRLAEAVRGSLEEGPDEAQPLVATALMLEASIRADLGNTAAARDLAARAAVLTEELYGPEHPQVADALRFLSGLELELGLYDDARGHLSRALELALGAFGEEHQFVADVRMNLGRLELMTGDIDRAREQTMLARDYYARGLSERHPFVATCCALLSLVEMEAGDPAASLAAVERALDIQTEIAPEDGNVATLRTQRAVALAWLGEREAAREEALSSAEASRAAVRTQVRLLTENEALPLRTLRGDVDLLVWLAEGPIAEFERVDAWDVVIHDRGLLLDEMAYRARLARSAGDPELAPLLALAQEGRRELSRLQSQGPGEDPEAFRARREEAEGAVAEAEKELLARSAVFRNRSVAESIGFGEVARALRPGQALVAFVRYGAQQVSKEALATPTALPRSMSPAGNRTVARYLAFVLRGGSSSPIAVPLGPASEVEAEVNAWRWAVLGNGSHREAGAALRRRVWDPIAEHVGDAELVFLVPDGALHLVNIAALPDRAQEASFLLETGPTFHGLSAERDLATPTGPMGQGLLAVGGVDYDAAGAIRLAVADERRAVNVLRALPECEAFESTRFERLPGTQQEIERIGAVWEARARDGDPLLLQGGRATEGELIRTVVGKRVLHLATHGFFLDSECAEAGRGGGEERGVVKSVPIGGGEVETSFDGDEALAKERSGASASLLLGGLALAGANRRGEASPGEDDGILTGLEIGALDLSGVEWVVLSACDTGLGRFAEGEGLFGLRRAFDVAGARTLIVSLWPVRDEDASAWMQALYAARLGEGASTAEAMRAAARARLEALRAEGAQPDPRAWGAFVATGRWE